MENIIENKINSLRKIFNKEVLDATYKAQKKYGFETLEEAKEKLEELSAEVEKNEKKKEKLMNELNESQDWDKIEEELED